MKTFRTFSEWKERGYGVIKGEKSSQRNENGVCVFSEDQVISLPVYKNEDELRWENNINVQEMIRERSMCGDRFAAMCVDLDRLGHRYGVDWMINYDDRYDACDDFEAF
jgi:hypothetical protein